VAVEQQAASATSTGEARDELRPPGEIDLIRQLAASGQLAGIGLPQVDRGAGALQALRELLLQRPLLSGRIAQVARGRVESNQCPCEIDQLAASLADRADHRMLQRGQPVCGSDLRSHFHCRAGEITFAIASLL
jgi:hypothetical protein